MGKTLPLLRKMQKSLPLCFTSFVNCRGVIDCTEFRCQVPEKLSLQKALYSSYKKYHTLKPFIIVSPNGTGIRCSLCYPGSTSDKKIAEHSQILKEFERGDMILADKGFLIQDLAPPGVTVNIPPFLMNKRFSVAEVMRTRSIAQARIHIERFNARVKNFNILDKVPVTSFAKASVLVQASVGLVNFQNPLLAEMNKDFLPDDETNGEDEDPGIDDIFISDNTTEEYNNSTYYQEIDEDGIEDIHIPDAGEVDEDGIGSIIISDNDNVREVGIENMCIPDENEVSTSIILKK